MLCIFNGYFLGFDQCDLKVEIKNLSQTCKQMLYEMSFILDRLFNSVSNFSRFC